MSAAGTPAGVTLRRWVLPAVLFVVAWVAAWAVSPGLRDEVRASFTRLPSTYTEVYFAAEPSRTGKVVSVPVTVVHHGAAAETITVRVAVTVAGATRAVDRTVAGVPGQAATRLFAITAPAGDCLVEVTLPGRPPSLHYRLDQEEAS